MNKRIDINDLIKQTGQDATMVVDIVDATLSGCVKLGAQYNHPMEV